MIHGHLNWHPGPTLPEVEASIQFYADQLPDCRQVEDVAVDATFFADL